MPELPEVETVRRGLERLLAGRRIIGIEVFNPGSFHLGMPDPSDGKRPAAASPRAAAALLNGRRVSGVRRRAKLLLIDLADGWCLAVHLKMTGQLVFVADAGERFGAGHPSDSLVDGLPDRSTRLALRMEGGTLWFNDQRKFGWVWLLPGAGLSALPFWRGLGPEPLEPDFSAADFSARLRQRPGSKVKAALLDQTVVAGIGNIYADESLWQAGIHPETRVRSLDDDALARLHAALREVMELSISLGGSTDRNYVDAEGRRGAYLGFAKVFRRQGQPCARCGSAIVKTRVAGRGTHWCPSCQAAP
jgi:formamidopyrimidine-DNA glycosylase